MSRTELDKLMSLHRKMEDTSHSVLFKKMHDYTNASDDPLSCLKLVERHTGIDSSDLIIARMIETISKLKTYSDKGHLKTSNDSLENSCVDLINWVVIFAFLHGSRSDKGMTGLCG